MRSWAKRRWRWWVGFVVVAGLLAGLIARVYRTVPRSNYAGPDADVILVLGSPTEMDGALTSAQRWRVDEAVREYRAGRARCMLMSGGPTMHGHVEADAMARYAEDRGVPATAVLEDRAAMTTIENIRNGEHIMEMHGWRRAEVISSADHLPRAALLLERTPLLWRTHAAPTPGRSRLQLAGAYAEEAVGTVIIRCGGVWIWPLMHGLAVAQGAVFFGFRWVFYRLQDLLKRV